MINHLIVINLKTSMKGAAVCYEPDISEVWLLKHIQASAFREPKTQF